MTSIELRSFGTLIPDFGMPNTVDFAGSTHATWERALTLLASEFTWPGKRSRYVLDVEVHADGDDLRLEPKGLMGGPVVVVPVSLLGFAVDEDDAFLIYAAAARLVPKIASLLGLEHPSVRYLDAVDAQVAEVVRRDLRDAGWNV